MNQAGQSHESPGRLVLLDALRTVAALLVMLFHLGPKFDMPWLMPRGYLMVDLFFCLSGFVLTRAYEWKFADGMGGYAFLKIRLRRLWPLIALGTVAGAAAQLAKVEPSAMLLPLAMGLLLIPAIDTRLPLYPLNSAQWSLSWEVAANLVHGLLLWRLGLRGLIAVAAASALGLVWAVPLHGNADAGGFAAMWWVAALRVGWSYTLGIILARVFTPKPRAGTAPQGLWLIALLAPVAITIALHFLPVSEAAGDLAMVLLVMPALFWFATQCRVPERLASLLERFGGLSFPLYALHVPVITAFALYTERPVHGLFAGVLVLAASALVARFGGPLGLGVVRRKATAPA